MIHDIEIFLSEKLDNHFFSQVLSRITRKILQKIAQTKAYLPKKKFLE